MPSFFRTLDLHSLDLHATPRAIREMRDGQIDGIILRGVYDPGACADICRRLENGRHRLFRTDFPPIMRAFFLGENLNLAHPDLRRYFALAPAFEDGLRDLFDPHEDVQQRLCRLFEAIDQGQRYCAAPGPAADTRHMFTTIRAHVPGDGDRVLDVGCGFGGALALLDTVLRGSRLVGVNIDQRQLRVCSEIRSISDNWLGLAGAAACALPFGRGAFDVVFCIEAMFHFESRMMFLSEAARVLRPGGRLVFTDFTFDEDGPTPPWRIETMTAALRDDYGPWPEVWLTPGALTKMTDTAGFETVEAQDWTGNTLPSYRVTAPHVGPFPSSRPDAGEVLCWLHHSGRLRYEARVLALSRIVAL